jgi:hypothetical protein
LALGRFLIWHMLLDIRFIILEAYKFAVYFCGFLRTMPFTEILTGIPVFVEDLIEGGHGHQLKLLFIPPDGICAYPVILNTVTGQDGGPCGCTNGTLGVCICKQHTLGSQPVKVRGFDKCIPGYSQGVGSLLVGHDKQKIGFGGLFFIKTAIKQE